MKIIFLDIDGVLNDHTHHQNFPYCTIDKDKAAVLQEILTETDARVVLSSAWRYLVHGGSMSLSGLRYLLFTHWIDGDRLLDITREDASAQETDRGLQIREWLSSYEGSVEKYVVLDDIPFDIAEHHPGRFYRVVNGLQKTDKAPILEILQ